jgi:nitrile hydratase subunit beta
VTNSVHDMGGMHGFGVVEHEDSEPVFQEEWQRKTFGLMMTSLGTLQVNLDHVRSRMESEAPATYLSLGYYDKWFLTLEKLAIDKGVINRDDLTKLAMGEDVQLDREVDPIPAEGMLAFIATGATAARQIETPASFKVGDQVRAKTLNPSGHTRLPRYVRGHIGTVIADQGGQIYPDSNATFSGEGPERLYTVQFQATELWGKDANPKDTVCIDLWEPYLEAAP